MFRKIAKNLRDIKKDIQNNRIALEYIRVALGRIESRMSYNDSIEKAEFKSYSQWGEDGIIQYLIQNVTIREPVFIEFGVEDYTESNTRFLLMNNNWSGLVIDGGKENIEKIRKWEMYWRYNLKAICKFVTKQNINKIILENGLQGEIGILSIDIDGNDYWIWKEINVVSPDIVICEYNSLYGYKKKVTTPYIADFVRENYHYSRIVYGASIAALNDLAEEKGYSMVTANQAGNNVFFVRNDLMGNLKKKTPEEVYRTAQFRETRNKNGELLFVNVWDRECMEMVADAIVYDLEEEREIKLSDVFEF